MRKLSLAAAALAIGCGPSSKRYTTELEIVRLTVIRTDASGAPLTVDVEMSFEQCPGEQRKTIRGDRAFAACVGKYKVGDRVAAIIAHEKSQDGIYHPRVVKLGDCERRIDPNDEASFEIVQVCRDLTTNGVLVGFHCDRKPTKELLAKCPWFRVR